VHRAELRAVQEVHRVRILTQGALEDRKGPVAGRPPGTYGVMNGETVLLLVVAEIDDLLVGL
jgi:hypothetical protein